MNKSFSGNSNTLVSTETGKTDIQFICLIRNQIAILASHSCNQTRPAVAKTEIWTERPLRFLRIHKIPFREVSPNGSSFDADRTAIDFVRLYFSDHFQNKEIPVYESLVTQCCPGIWMVILIQ